VEDIYNNSTQEVEAGDEFQASLDYRVRKTTTQLKGLRMWFKW
jgi:hypothetical protein